MAYDQYLAERVRRCLTEKKVSFTELKMFGGICFKVDDKMLCGLLKDKSTSADLLMARVGEQAYENLLEKEFCLPMDFTGRPMKGYVFVQAQGIDMEDDLAYWIDQCLTYNPLAKASKKRKKTS